VLRLRSSESGCGSSCPIGRYSLEKAGKPSGVCPVSVVFLALSESLLR
jgi:hypothetical protein